MVSASGNESPRAMKACVVAKSSQVVALGSVTSVPEKLLAAARQACKGRSSDRLGGENRYATSALIVKWEIMHGMKLEGAGFATGQSFPDALASSFLLGAKGSILGLVAPVGDNAPMTSAIKAAVSAAASPALMRVFGGVSSVPDAVRAQITKAAGWTSWKTVAK